MTYEPPYSGIEIKRKYGYMVFKNLQKDPVHKWRMDTGIELIHKEPSLKELLRIKKNWDQMSIAQKKISDKKSIELFGVDNTKHFYLLLKEYDDFEEMF